MFRPISWSPVHLPMKEAVMCADNEVLVEVDDINKMTVGAPLVI
jgi:hypothetical protein